MTTGLPQAGQIFIDQLPVAHRSEAWKMTAMHDAHRQRANALESSLIVATVGMIGIIDERSVIDDITRQEDSGPALEESDAAR